MERTLIILKPDCIAQQKVGEILSRFEAQGFEFIAAKITRLSTAQLNEHYAHVADKPFYPQLVEFMTERPVMILILEAENAIARVRELMGPTNPEKADKGTIRGDLGTNTLRNVIHASDSLAGAEAEIARFFSKAEIPALGTVIA